LEELAKRGDARKAKRKEKRKEQKWKEPAGVAAIARENER